MYTRKEREEYNQQRNRTCKRLGITKNQYNWLRRKGQALRKIYEDNCNGIFKTELEYSQSVKPYYCEVGKYIQDIKLFVYYQADPRGATVYLDKNPIKDNAYTNACCIY